jgi:hypothetical protein
VTCAADHVLDAAFMIGPNDGEAPQSAKHLAVLFDKLERRGISPR